MYDFSPKQLNKNIENVLYCIFKRKNNKKALLTSVSSHYR